MFGILYLPSKENDFLFSTGCSFVADILHKESYNKYTNATHIDMFDDPF